MTSSKYTVLDDGMVADYAAVVDRRFDGQAAEGGRCYGEHKYS